MAVLTINTVTAPGHNFNNGDQVFIEGVIGFGGVLNGQIFTVSNVTANTFQIQTNVPCAYQRGGTARKLVTSVPGPAYLNGQLVSVVTNGENVSTQVYNNGVTGLSPAAWNVHIGLPYTGTVKFLPLGGDGQTQNRGKKRKLYDVMLVLWKSLGGSFGMDENSLIDLDYSTPENENLNPDDDVLWTGDLHYVPIESEFEDYVAPVFVQN